MSSWVTIGSDDPDAVVRMAQVRARQAALLKKRVQQRLGLGDDCTLSVHELRCAEPDCPDLETVIAIFRPGTAPLRLRILKPVADVTDEDLAGLP
jgi:hypothetical protein